MYWTLVDLPSSSSFLGLEKVLGSVGPISAASEMGNCLEHLMKVKGRSRTASILGGPARWGKSGGLQRTTRLWDHNPDIFGHFSLARPSETELVDLELPVPVRPGASCSG